MDVSHIVKRINELFNVTSKEIFSNESHIMQVKKLKN